MTEHAIHARFDVRQGEFSLQAELNLPGRGVTALFGHSGAGKTTLLRAIAGLERHRGYLRVNDEVWQDDENGVFMPTHCRALGYVFQEASLLPHLTVQCNLEFGWRRTGLANCKVGKEEILSLLGVKDLLGRFPANLSGGERQRVAIARALLASPKLLLMDEPLASLEEARKQEVLPYLERIHDELAIPVIYVSHSQDEVTRLADYIVLLESGKVLASGPIADITSRLDLSMAFDDSAGAVIEGTVESYDEEYQLGQLRVTGGVIQVAHRKLPLGTRLRLRILARDVSLSLAPHENTSILNQLPAQVVAEVPAKSEAHVVIRLDVGGLPLLARITRQSRDRLELALGKQVWTQFKAVTILSAR